MWMVLAMVCNLLRDRQHVGDDRAPDPDRGRHLCQQGAVLGLVVGVARSPPWPPRGLAQINALGNLSAFFFNYMIGWIKDETGSFPLAIMPIAVVATLGRDRPVDHRKGSGPRTMSVSRRK